jgi:hypothetical protein
MRDEHVPNPAIPEQPPFAPHDPPEPAPQAAAWRRALKVVGSRPPVGDRRLTKGSSRIVTRG